MELSEARRLKELERENSELEKKMLAEALLKNRVLEAVAGKKRVSPAHRRQAAHAVVRRGLCSGRMACRFLWLARATFLYRGQPPSAKQARLARRLRALSEAHPRCGYRRIDLSLKAWTRGSATSRKHNRHEHHQRQGRQEI